MFHLSGLPRSFSSMGGLSANDGSLSKAVTQTSTVMSLVKLVNSDTAPKETKTSSGRSEKDDAVFIEKFFDLFDEVV